MAKNKGVSEGKSKVPVTSPKPGEKPLRVPKHVASPSGAPRPVTGMRKVQTYIVHGTITDAAGQLVVGARVQAFDRDLRREEQLGEKISGPDGSFRITYASSDFRRAEKTGADLRVCVVDEKGRELATSEVWFKAPTDAEVNLQLPAKERAGSEFERLMHATSPLLKGQGQDKVDLPLAALEEKDIQFLVRETGEPADLIRALVAAARSVVHTSVEAPPKARKRAAASPPEAIPVSALYAWHKRWPDTALARLVVSGSESLLGALDDAAARGEIPQVTDATRTSIRSTVDAFYRREALGRADGEGPARLGDFLALAAGNTRKWAERLALKGVALHEHLKTADLAASGAQVDIAALVDDAELGARVFSALRLGTLTGQHAALTAVLQEKVLKADIGMAVPEAALASIDRAQWIQLAAEHGVPPTRALSVEEYAEELQVKVEQAAPVAVLSHVLATAQWFAEPRDPHAAPFKALAQALRRNPEADLLGKTAKALAEEMRLGDDAKQALGTLQNLKRVDVRWEEAPHLIERHIDSPAALMHLGAKGFKAHLRDVMPERRIDEIWNRASATAVGFLGLRAMLVQYVHGAPSPVMHTRSSKEVQDLFEAHPSLATLFGSLDQCACDPCLSVLSPAAYLADLLAYIDGQGASEARRLLEARRPDIYHLKLSCENSEIEVAHIDLVNEILESAIAFPRRAALPAGTAITQPASTTPTAAVQSELAATVTGPLGALMAVRQPAHPGDLYGVTYWTISDRFRQWSVTGEEEYFGFEPMTGAGLGWTAAERGTLIQALDDNRLDAQMLRDPRIQRAFRHAISVPNLPLNVTDAGIEGRGAADGVTRWEIRLAAAGRVTVVPGSGAVGAVTLASLGTPGQSLSFQLQNRQAPAIAAELAAGRFPNLLLTLCNEHSKVKIRVQSDGANTWRYAIERPVTMAYRQAGIWIRGLCYQSSDSSRDLLLEPQNRNPLAYAHLNNPDAVYPWSLPYDARLQETRVLLDAAHLPRIGWLTAGRRWDDRLENIAILRERLGMSSQELQLIEDSATASLESCWGFQQASRLEDLRNVAALLRQSKLAYGELIELLGSAVVNPAGAVGISLPQDCRMENATLSGVSDNAIFHAFLSRFHRYVRIWRKLALPIALLDRALLRADVAQPLGSSSLQGLSHLLAVANSVNTGLEKVLDWFDDGPESLRRALGMDGDEFASAVLVLARAGAPFTVAAPLGSPSELHRFITEIEHAQRYGQSWSELAYALHHAGPQLAVLDWPQQERLQWMKNFHDQNAAPQMDIVTNVVEPDEVVKARWYRWGLTPVNSSPTDWSVPDPANSSRKLTDQPLDLLRRWKVLKTQSRIDASLLEQMLDARGRRVDSTGRITSLDIRDLDQLELWLDWFSATDPVGALCAELLRHLNMAEAVTRDLLALPLHASGTSVATDRFVRWLLAPLPADIAASPLWGGCDACLLRLQKIAMLNKVWKAGPEHLRWLQSDTTGSKYAVIEPSRDLALTGGGAVGASPPSAYGAWKRTTTLVALARIGPGMATVLEAYRKAGADVAGPPARYPRWLVLQEAFRLGDVDMVRAVAGALGDAPNSPDQRVDPLWLGDLLGALALLQKTGIGADQFAALSEDAATDIAIAAAHTLLARLDDSARKDALRRVQDALREERRNRLTDFLLWRDNLPDSNALYARYLIDPQMSACMNTTRMLQATAAVQLLVQRCLLNLEKDALPDRFDTRRWQWMSAYRIWEANRKVFLYPENWLYPELRDDRTETFRQYECQIVANESGSQNAERALRAYTESLVDLSRIDVVAMCEGVLPGRKRLDGSHFRSPNFFQVGQLASDKKRWFFREARIGAIENAEMRWSGWETLDVDASGEHVVLFIHDNQLHLAWSIVTTEKDQSTGLEHYKLQLAYVRQVDEGWINRTTTVECPKTLPVVAGRSAQVNLHFAVDKRFGDTQLNVWHATNPVTPGVLPQAEFILVAQERYRSPRGSEVVRSYWTLHFSTTAYVRFDNTGRVARARCRCILIDVAPYDYDANNQPPLMYSQSEQFGPIDAEAGWSVDVRNSLILKVSAEIEIPGLTPLTFVAAAPQVLQFDFSEDNAALGGAPEGGDQFTARLTFTTTYAVDPKTANESDALSMMHTGAFVFLAEGVQWIATLPYANGTLVPKPGFQFWNSRERQVTATAVASLEGHATNLTDLPGLGRMQITTAAPRSISRSKMRYLVESGNRFLVSGFYVPPFTVPPPLSATERSPGRKAIFAAGYPDASLYRSKVMQDPSVLYAQEVQDAPLNSELGVGATDNYFVTRAQLDVRNISDPHFDSRQPYSIYNWELFLHAPLSAAVSLSRQHQFADARRWFHFVFDPTTGETRGGRSRYWKFLPFRHREVLPSITEWLQGAANPNADSHLKDLVQAQITSWADDPFNPFAVARLRPAAFEWFTVIAYVRNLLDWGDQLFRRETRESIAEAVQIYVLAEEILGPRPRQISSRRAGVSSGSASAAMSYRELEQIGPDRIGTETFGNAWLGALDNPLVLAWLRFMEQLAQRGILGPKALSDFWESCASLASTGSLYFCVPPNEKLIELWDRVEARLFNIRHCSNIDGLERPLPWYEPPIDPELLIRARAVGLDLADVLSERFAPTGPYRFQVWLQKASEFCNEVKGLGAALLGAVEKKEGEHLSLLRSQQEIAMLRLVERVKSEQIKEAQANIEALEKTRHNAVDRLTYLQRQLGSTELQLDAAGAPIVSQSLIVSVRESGMPDDFRGLALIQAEIDQVARLQDGHIWSMVAGASKASAGVFHTLAANPINVTWASAFGNGLSAIGDGIGLIATNASFWERRAALIASWQRRRDEWVQQSKMTAEEIRQIDKQLLALEIRKSIAEKELENHRKQIEFAGNVDDYLRHLKFSGEALYGWMESQLASVYFGAYQMAIDLARRAERALQHELGDESLRFVQFGHWDSLRKGLMSGERLGQDLRRMEAHWFNRNVRELEITKHVSLRQLDPEALMRLRATGHCDFSVPEWLFDLDFPGHYFRRIKSVSISVPAVVGPYTGVAGTLTLQSSKTRHSNLAGGAYDDAARYHISRLPIEAIATSSGQNDSGLFELNFRDERYLPFEGAGAISDWKFTLPAEFRAFDYDTISDVIVHLRYTARNGGQSLSDAVNTSLDALLQSSTDGPMHQLLSLRRDFSTQWQHYRSGPAAGLTIELTEDHFPYLTRSRIKLAATARLAWVASDTSEKTYAESNVQLSAATLPLTLTLTNSQIESDDPYLIVGYMLKGAQ